jgi:hypothetical protein
MIPGALSVAPQMWVYEKSNEANAKEAEIDV